MSSSARASAAVDQLRKTRPSLYSSLYEFLIRLRGSSVPVAVKNRRLKNKLRNLSRIGLRADIIFYVEVLGSVEARRVMASIIPADRWPDLYEYASVNVRNCQILLASRQDEFRGQLISILYKGLCEDLKFHLEEWWPSKYRTAMHSLEGCIFPTDFGVLLKILSDQLTLPRERSFRL